MDCLESTTELTLQHHCGFKIISHILVNCKCVYKLLGVGHSGKRMKFNVALDELQLPATTKDFLRTFIKPITKELTKWYDGTFIHPAHVEPIFTWRGTLNIPQMVEKVVEDESQLVLVRYAYACEYCLVNLIPTLMKQLTPDDQHTIERGPFHEFCIAKLMLTQTERIAASRDDEDLLLVVDQDLLNYIAQSALGKNSDTALKYLAKLPLEVARQYLYETLRDDMCYFTLSPAAFHRLYAKLSPTQQKDVAGLLSSHVLIAYLRWPYQMAFIDVAESLVGNLDKRYFKRVLKFIIFYHMKKDYDYSQILFFFWKRAAERENGFFTAPSPRDQNLVGRVHMFLRNSASFGLIKHTFSSWPLTKRSFSEMENENSPLYVLPSIYDESVPFSLFYSDDSDDVQNPLPEPD